MKKKQPTKRGTFDEGALLAEIFPIRIDFVPEKFNSAMVPFYPNEVVDREMVFDLNLCVPFHIESGHQAFFLESALLELQTTFLDHGITINEVSKVKFRTFPVWKESWIDELARDLTNPVCDMLEGVSDGEFWRVFNRIRAHFKAAIIEGLPPVERILEHCSSEFCFDFNDWKSLWEARRSV